MKVDYIDNKQKIKGTQKSEQFVHISGKSNIANELAIVQFMKQL